MTADPFTIAIVLYPGMTALDAIGPYEVLRLVPGAEVRFVGNEVGPVAADSGVLFLGVTHTFVEVPAPDVVLVPGSGRATATAMADRDLLAWLRATHPGARWTTSVCTGALVLAAAGLLEGRPATTHWLAQGALAAMGAEPRRRERVVVDGTVATAAGVSAGIDLGLWLAEQLSDRETAEMIQLGIEYAPRPHLDAGHPDRASTSVRRRAREVLLRRAVGS